MSPPVTFMKTQHAFTLAFLSLPQGTGQRRVTILHALDALFLYGKDVRSYAFSDRQVYNFNMTRDLVN